MELKPRTSTPVQVILVLASLVVIGAAITQLKSLINPLLIAVLLSVLFSPVLNWLKRVGLPNFLAVACTMVVMILCVSVSVNLLAVSFEDFARDLPSLYHQLEAKVEDLLDQLPFSLAMPGLDLSMPGILNGETLAGIITSSVQGVLQTFSNLLLVVVLVLFILLEATLLAGKVSHFPTATAQSLAELTNNVKRYLVIKSFFSLLTGCLVGGFLWIYGIEYPLLMGAVAFLLNFIPAIGSIVAAIPALILALVNHSFVDAVLVLMWYTSVNVLIGNILEPRQMGKEMGLSPLVVFLSLMLWGWLLGPVGMFMAVPLSMVIKIILNTYQRTKWLALLMG